ncbi:MAG TPA: extracellular solute-binding protein [Xanthobacteraceae bacterium]|nr:extracellular solute-binding protein [Xanthobacteraceae bacterium]
MTAEHSPFLLSRRQFAAAAMGAGLLASPFRSALAQTPADWDATVAAAKKEGKLLVYNGSNFPVVKRIAASVQKQYGITVDVLDGRATEIRERIRVEQATNRPAASLTYTGYTTMFLQKQEGAFQPHGDLPNAGKVDKNLAGDGTILLGSVGLFIMMYNTNLVKPDEAPKSWADLLDPKWQGKMLSDDYRAAGAGAVWFEATYNKFGREFHEKMARQKPVFSRNFPDSERRVARGEYAIYLPFNVSEFITLRGLPIKAVVPEEGAAYVPFGSAMLKDAPHPNAARVFLNHLLAEEGQTMLASEGFRPAVPGFEDKAPPEVAPLVQGNLLGTTTPGRLDEMLKLAIEIYGK